MTALDKDVEVDRATLRRVIASSFTGTTLEYYEFFVYATMAALIFNHQFFPTIDPVAGMLASFATFAVGFIARPIGGILLGALGDRLGRKKTLVWSLLLMGGSTVAIGFIPSYATIGVWAPVLLVLMRILQGLALGGEWGGAALMLVENAPRGRRFAMGSVVNMGTPGGLVLSTGVIAICVAATGDAFDQWGWRIPFLFSAVLIAIGWYIRNKVGETPEFRRVMQEAEVRKPARTPIREVLRSHWRDIARIFLICSPSNAVYFIVATYTLNYATSAQGLNRDSLIAAQFVAAAIYLVVLPFWGMLADRIGPLKVIMAGCVISALFAFPYFMLLESGSLLLTFVGMAFALIFIHGTLQAPQAGLFAERFDVRIRYSGVAFGQALPTAIVGGTAPFIATLLYSLTGTTYLISAYMLFFALVGAVTTYRWKRSPDPAPEGTPTAVVREATP
jgi:MHS family shikimate/dehydroshikimate transporter-like MFS transporter